MFVIQKPFNPVENWKRKLIDQLIKYLLIKTKKLEKKTEKLDN